MRKILWPVLVVGVLLIVAPFVIGLPSRAGDGQDMIDAFKPVMDKANVDKTVDYYDNVFVPLGNVVPAMSKDNIAKFQAYLTGIGEMQTDAANLVPGLAKAMGMTNEQVQQMIATNYPAMSQMLANLPQMQKDFGDLLGLMSANVDIFSKVPAGLAHYKPLVDTMKANVGTYDSISGLPNFNLFTWFFVVPGVVLVGLAGWGLLSTRKPVTAVAE